MELTKQLITIGIEVARNRGSQALQTARPTFAAADDRFVRTVSETARKAAAESRLNPTTHDFWPEIDTAKVVAARPLKQITDMQQHIGQALQQAERGDYKKGFNLLADPEKARALGIEINLMHPASMEEVGFFDACYAPVSHLDDGIEDDISGIICLASLDALEKLKGPSIRKEWFYSALEEWVHALQDAQGQPLSKAVRQFSDQFKIPDSRFLKDTLEDALMASNDMRSSSEINKYLSFETDDGFPEIRPLLEILRNQGQKISDDKWVAEIEKTFGKKLSEEGRARALKLPPGEIVELDFAQFLKEKNISWAEHIHHNHQRHLLMDSP